MSYIPLQSYILTTLKKVKDALGIAMTTTTDDEFFEELINLNSMWASNYCGGRNFLTQSYTEIYDTRKNSQKIFLRQRPVTSTQNGSGTDIVVNYRSGIPTNPVWVTYDPNSYLLYNPEGYLHFYGYLPKVHQGLQIIYSAGYKIAFTPLAISAMNYASSTVTVTVASNTLLATGDTVQIMGSSVSADNAEQVITVVSPTSFTFQSSTAGARTGNMSVIDLSAEYDTTRHTLPQDLTYAVTDMVKKDYNLRYAQGQTLVVTEGQRIQYSDKTGKTLDTDVKAILDSYRTPHFAV